MSSRRGSAGACVQNARITTPHATMRHQPPTFSLPFPRILSECIVPPTFPGMSSMPTVEYHYARALELEGRHPSDAGCWNLTVERMGVGEGLPRHDSPWWLVAFPEGEPIPPSRRAPPETLFRYFYYRRIRSSTECDRHMMLARNSPVVLAFHLTAAWENPPGGMIPVPSEADLPIPLTHASASC
jgi:hypothetical protein